jgi:hypothetical protein
MSVQRCGNPGLTTSLLHCQSTLWPLEAVLLTNIEIKDLLCRLTKFSGATERAKNKNAL